jgi:hypothetical protein
MTERVIELLPFSAVSMRTERRDRTTLVSSAASRPNGTSGASKASRPLGARL